MGSIVIDGIEIEVIRKKIKNMNLYILPPDGRVRITAPLRMNDITVRNFAVSKLNWIKKHREKYLVQEMQSEKKFVSGEIHLYLGKEYLLNVVYTNKRQRVEICNEKGIINMYVREGSTAEKRKKILTEWYRKQLKK